MAQTQENSRPLPHSHADVQYPPSEISLSLREWLVAGAIVAAALALAPILGARAEPVPDEVNYRIPYALADDYWLFDRWAGAEARAGATAVVGDSVVWGHYVPADCTLPSGAGGQYTRVARPAHSEAHFRPSPGRTTR